jgi:hypothetical protein
MKHRALPVSEKTQTLILICASAALPKYLGITTWADKTTNIFVVVSYTVKQKLIPTEMSLK